MFKIKLENGEYFKNNSGRTQHYRSIEKTDAKIHKLGEIATGATVVECKARTAAAKTEKENAFDTKVVSSKSKKAKPEIASKDKVESGKEKKAKKSKHD